MSKFLALFALALVLSAALTGCAHSCSSGSSSSGGCQQEREGERNLEDEEEGSY